MATPTAFSIVTDPHFQSLPTWLLSQAALRSDRVLHRRLAAAGASGYEYRLLSALTAAGSATQAQLGRLALLDRSDVAGTIAALEHDGAVTRRRSPDDGRVQIVSLTAAGRRRHRRLARIVEAVQEEVLAGLSVTERDRLVRALGRVAEPQPAPERGP